MSEPERKEQAPANTEKNPADATENSPEAKLKLSAEEQMALYEEHLKETDWGHQPC